MGKGTSDAIVFQQWRGIAKGTAAMITQRFPIHLGRQSRLVLMLFGVRPSNAYVDLADDELDAHFGSFRFRTPTSNLASWRIEGPWRWITAIGVRFSVRQHDLRFGGTNRGGVRVDFREPASQLGVRVPALYLTVTRGSRCACHHRPSQTQTRTLPWRTQLTEILGQSFRDASIVARSDAGMSGTC